eukprot:Gregarina_sp_Poly_1__1483@NODE_1370_length_4273_cov_48_215882_g918_i0_p4_GENE_NODE_1370_length_4273_cov_48_215882_g918_i0NODE_1370_length_4273_cov_48_215882_g918_i0_p4_ORF_typecomplete_len102_score5_96_NODE_1370_length_4273_cov_48_215882_g918_i025442849
MAFHPRHRKIFQSTHQASTDYKSKPLLAPVVLNHFLLDTWPPISDQSIVKHPTRPFTTVKHLNVMPAQGFHKGSGFPRPWKIIGKNATPKSNTPHESSNQR